LRGSIETRVGIFVLAALAVFGYMGFQTGAFRFDRLRYNMYAVYFKDITGLARKGDVKIAGVKVGWVKKISLVSDDGVRVKAELMVLKEYALYDNAYAIVRQDGLLGPRYVELVPGDPYMRRLKSGEELLKPSAEPVSMDELLVQFKHIAQNVSDVTDSFKSVVGDEQGKERLMGMIDNMSVASDRISSLAQTLDGSFSRNIENIDTFLDLGTNIKHLAHRLEDQVLPSFQDNIERIANKFESTTEALEEASIQARDGLHNISLVAEKINEGRGLIGKLVNDEESYRDLKVAVQGVRNYVTKLDHLKIVCDAHSESMHRRAEYYRHEDTKGYFDVRIYPNQDHFYLIQLAGSEKGYVYRTDTDRQYYDMNSPETYPEGSRFDVRTLSPVSIEPQNFLREYVEIYRRNTTKFGLQFGKIFGDFTFRCGLFEGTAGVGVDIEVPLTSDRMRWITTIELFDFRGWNRKADRRPHVKWLNRMFFMNNLYFVFGADDFGSKRNANIFFGAGMRFGDDEIKYILSNISGITNSTIGD
jgi:phospholipid/cholesterol/gamma-HCH transport system substrate-binding protein